MNSATHPEKEERKTIADNRPKVRSLRKCNEPLRQKIIELRADGWSNNNLSKRIGHSTSAISQYLNEAGCVYEGDVPKLERAFNDLLQNEARRRASGVDTIKNDITKQIRNGLEEIRKTNDVGLIISDAGTGKTRGTQSYAAENPTALLFRATMWCKDQHAVATELFETVGYKDYDNRTRRTPHTIRNLQGSDRLIIFDDAHKLTRPALQFVFDLHDETQCPIAFVGIKELLVKIQEDAQRFSRVGYCDVLVSDEKHLDPELLKHLVKSLFPGINGELEELIALAEQVAAEHGHYRSVHKQLKLAREIKAGNDSLNYVQAFRAAHTMLVRNYNLR